MSLACYRKKAYPNRAAAWSVVFAFRAKGNDGISAYQCDVCKKWHLSATKLIPEVR